ncbi:Uncharacterised protein [Mycobacteroides abscessus subsp. massiliense]|uniref:hypothetical protein n=1 Tax=Mycobacteroides TaxID=670516 RepID=UPI000927E1C0|nr:MULTISPECIES: hypothetical protein [Mycobacteroides]SHX53632.1 Uncharacterised protein [Mycobacteroides abscessus subsp. abscessus]SKM75537.1 Uncharacterised protein [Mycobacteroides abscessus subsp. massiliense]SKM77275.1 Uncharacterised protein [Mycobacteroides abscessus subsp. massiliense]SKM87666.1 Uncharacterised protein [Mycobacteroides abscessus subsp. massiliense]SKN87342.1 Uncharacterised protein [Mycobacteroides abscessus subsp. massiliense]
MNGPTKSAILGADLNSYHGKLDTYKPFAAHYESVISKLKGSIYKPSGTYWDGATAEAGQHNTESGWKFTAKVHDIIDTYNSAAAPIIDNTIVPELTNAQHIIENVESQRDKGITCSEDLKLTYTPLPGTSEKVIEENTKLVQARQAELTKSANAWLAGCQQVAQLVTTAQQDITGVLNSAAGTFDINKALAATAPRATPNSTVKPDNYLAALQGQAGEGAGDTKPTAAPIGDTIDYKKVYPKDVSVGDKSVDPSKLGGVGAIPGVRDSATGREPPAKLAPALQAKDVPAFKEMTREVLTRQGVPADQIEAQVNKAVENAQNPRLVRTDVPSASPSEHVSRDFGEQWNKFFANASDGGSKAGDAILDEGKKLTGLAGPGAPGVAEAWGALAKDTAKGLYDYATMTPQERLEMLGNEAQRAADNPGGYLGEKLVQGAAGAATGAVGGEAAAGLRGLVGDLTHTPHPEIPGGAGHAGGDVPGHHPSPGGDHTPGAVAAEHAVGPLRSADDILHEARDSHRAIRDQMDWDRGEQNLQDLATHHGVSVDELPRTPQYDIHHPTYTDKLGPEHSAEIDRHTQLWEHGFNTQSVQQVLDHMEADRPSTTGLRDELRQGLTRYGAEDLMDAGYSPMEADRLAKAYANEQFPRDSGLIPQPATHNPDGAIGGYPNALTYGDWQVNNALGTLTKQEKDAFRAWLQTQDPNAIVNINLGRK